MYIYLLTSVHVITACNHCMILADDTPLQPRKTERISMDSNKNILEQERFGTQFRYRTHSHAGLPKGSYAVPNPVHYHIARICHTAQCMRPIIVKLGYPKKHNYLPTNSTVEHINRPMVTIKIEDTRAIKLDIPIQTLKEFIFPFANALNITNAEQLRTTGSQTTFINHPNEESRNNSSSELSVTQLFHHANTGNVSEDDISENSTYEMQIMQNLRNKLIEETAEIDEETTEIDEETAEIDEEYEKFETEELESNWNLSNLARCIIDKAMNIDKNLSILQNTIEDVISYQSEGNNNVIESSSTLSWKSCSSLKVDNLENINVDLYDNLQVHTGVDEGVELSSDSIINAPNLLILANDETVTMMSETIYDYLVQQCFEVKELILFPEIFYDENIIKLYAKLQTLYKRFLNDSFTSEDKSVLRLNIEQEIMRKLKIDERIVNTNSSPDSDIVTDKIFTITEVISDILDNFFGKYCEDSLLNNDSKGFSQFSEDLERNGQSTPECTTPLNDLTKENTVKKNETDNIGNEIVISFKAKESKNLGNEKYWIAITKSPDSNKILPKKKEIINVDEIPLKPPADLSTNELDETNFLSPILEEPVSNIHSQLITSDNGNIQEVVLNGSLKADENGNKNTADSNYTVYDHPEINTVVCNSVTFLRTNTINSFSYIQTSSVNIVKDEKKEEEKKTKNDEEKKTKNNEESEVEDWMGYKSAKF